MQTYKTELSDVIYNAANQAFEALVTVRDFGHTHKYPCAITAPITMDFKDAAEGLTRQANRRHKRKLKAQEDTPRFAAPHPVNSRRFDAARWLRGFADLGQRRAA